MIDSLLRHFCHSQHCHTIRHSLYQALLLLDVWFEAEVDALALSPDAAGGTGALPADAVLAIIDGAALLVEGAEAVGRVKGVPKREEMKSYHTTELGYKVGLRLRELAARESLGVNSVSFSISGHFSGHF